MRVAQFVHRYPPAVGGAEAYTARLTEYLQGRGDEVEVWTSTAVELGEMWGRKNLSPQPPPLRREGEQEGYSPPFLGKGPGEGLPSPVVRRYHPIRFPLRRYVLKAASLVPVRPWQCVTLPCNPVCPGMWRDARRFTGPLDAVHAVAFPYSFHIYTALRLARRRNVPFLLTPFLHFGDLADPADRTRRQYTQPCLRWLLRQADRVFAMTAGERDVIVSLGVEPRRVIVQGLGVGPAECTGGDRDAARRSWGVTDEVVVGHLANNSLAKGSIDLLVADEILSGRGVRCRFVFAGPEMPDFRRACHLDPFGPPVTRLGVLTEADKQDFFAGIDAFALPSRSDSFGLVLLEAWANAKPVVVYRAGGPGELVRDGVDGRTTECRPEALADALAALVEVPDERDRLGRAGRDRAAVGFRWADKLAVFRAALEEVVAEDQSGHETDQGSRG